MELESSNVNLLKRIKDLESILSSTERYNLKMKEDILELQEDLTIKVSNAIDEAI